MQYGSACTAAKNIMYKVLEEDATKLAQAKNAHQTAQKALVRGKLPPSVENYTFQPPTTPNLDPTAELTKQVRIVAEIAQTIAAKINELWRLQQKLRRQRALRKKLLLVAGIAILILIGIIGYKINRALEPRLHYEAAMAALEAKEWEKAQSELMQVVAIKKDYKETRTLLRLLRENQEDFSLVLQKVLSIEFVWIPPGCFQIGSPETEPGRNSDEGPVHEVCVDGFWMGKYEVTQAQWEKVMGKNPLGFSGADRPVEHVLWNGAQEFIDNLNRYAGKEIYRLPTEAEWEYAARAGTQTAYSFGDDPDLLGEYAWYNNNSSDQTHPVGQLKPNAWGLYDMHGNVWEWCQDWYDKNYYSESPKENPQGPMSGLSRVYRGGGWGNSAVNCRAAIRSNAAPGVRRGLVGFRLVRKP